MRNPLLYFILFFPWAIANASIATSDLSACRKPVLNRGVIPESTLREFIDWAKSAPDEVFTVNSKYDVYSSVVGELGPYRGLTHRRAVMVDVLRVLGGFESSWDYSEGIDVNNGSSAQSKCNEEAGIFQTSANSMTFDRSLKTLFIDQCSGLSGKTDCIRFINCSKNNPKHLFVIEYTARLIRFTVNHHGPLKRREIHKWLRRDCVSAVEKLLL